MESVVSIFIEEIVTYSIFKYIFTNLVIPPAKSCGIDKSIHNSGQLCTNVTNIHQSTGIDPDSSTTPLTDAVTNVQQRCSRGQCHTESADKINPHIGNQDHNKNAFQADDEVQQWCRLGHVKNTDKQTPKSGQSDRSDKGMLASTMVVSLRCYSGATLVLLVSLQSWWCHSGVTLVLLWYYSGAVGVILVLVVSLWCYSGAVGVTPVLLWCYWCHSGATLVLLVSFWCWWCHSGTTPVLLVSFWCSWCHSGATLVLLVSLRCYSGAIGVTPVLLQCC